MHTVRSSWTINLRGNMTIENPKILEHIYSILENLIQHFSSVDSNKDQKILSKVEGSLLKIEDHLKLNSNYKRK